jgi:hypothetical protein
LSTCQYRILERVATEMQPWLTRAWFPERALATCVPTSVLPGYGTI